MKVKILRDADILLETQTTSLNIDENGYVDFYTPDGNYFTTTQGRNPGDTETTLWVEMFDEEDEEEPLDIVGIPFSRLKVFIMIAEDWIEVPQKDIFKD